MRDCCEALGEKSVKVLEKRNINAVRLPFMKQLFREETCSHARITLTDRHGVLVHFCDAVHLCRWDAQCLVLFTLMSCCKNQSALCGTKPYELKK